MCKLCIDCHDLFIELLIVQLFSAASVFVYCLYMNDNVKTIQINMKDNHSHQDVECTVLHAIIWLSEYVTHVIRTQSCNPSTYSLICLPVHRWLMPVLTQAFIKLSPLISTDLTVPRVNYVASPVNVWPDRWYRLQLDAGQGVLYDASDLLACVKLWYGHHMEGHLEQTIWYRDWFSSLQNFRNSSLRVLEFGSEVI